VIIIYPFLKKQISNTLSRFCEKINQSNTVEMIKSPSSRNLTNPFSKWFSDINWRFIVLIIPLFSFIIFFSFHAPNLNDLSSFSSVKNLLIDLPLQKVKNGLFSDNTVKSPTKDELLRSKIAVCLVGGARRFELTGPSILDMILKEYPNSDLFLNSPLDSDSFKFSLLKFAPKIAAIKIFHPQPLPENESSVHVLTADNSPNGIQVCFMTISLFIFFVFYFFIFINS
jgi:hypothetical protein